MKYHKINCRKRTCTSPSPSNGGYPCFGRSSEASECKPETIDSDGNAICSTAIANTRLLEADELNLLPVR